MSECKDKYTGKDKVKHFCVCLALSVICPVLGIIAAIAKGAYDMKQNGNHWCWKDIVADVAGIIVGTIIFSLLHY
jgi:uncharacterized protein YfiM (DUF2279 family)